jgi:endonuclease/exonuclease/phosphatase (EEP) superfamily protein YafD
VIIPTPLKRLARVAVIMLAAVSLLGSVALYLPLPVDFPPLLLLEFGPRWLLALGVLPIVVLKMPWGLRAAVVVLVLVLLVRALDYRSGGCGAGASGADLRIGTYNVGGGFVLPAELLLWYGTQGLDALLLQEVNQPQFWREAAAEAGLTFLCQSKLCLVTQHAVTPGQMLDRRQLGAWGGYAARYDLCTGARCLPLINVHLTTPRHAIEALIDRKPLAQVRKYMRERAMESSIASLMTDAPDAILAGDFNMTQQSSLYRRFWSRWANAFGEGGCGRGHTKFTRKVSARIDHILVGADYDVLRAQTHASYGGDHRPVTAQLRLHRHPRSG